MMVFFQTLLFAFKKIFSAGNLLPNLVITGIDFRGQRFELLPGEFQIFRVEEFYFSVFLFFLFCFFFLARNSVHFLRFSASSI